MADQENKERRVLYGEKNDGESIAETGAILGLVLILAAIVSAVQTVMLISDHDISPIEVILRIAGIVLQVFLAVRLSNALQALGQLVEENAKLKTAIQYLFETHNIEVHSCSEVSQGEIPGTVDDGFETMRIEEDGVHFRKPGPTVKCPFCDHEQPAGMDYCDSCGQRFFFEK